MSKIILTLIGLIFIHSSISAQKINGFETLGENVNSATKEIMPLVSIDGKTLYFVRDGHPENNCYQKFKAGKLKSSQDIWYSELQTDKTWGKAKHMTSPFNQNCLHAIDYISPDNNSVFSVTRKGFKVSHKTETGWSDFEETEIKGMKTNNVGVNGYITFAPNQKVMILSFSTKQDGVKNNFYISFLKKNNSWSKPKKMPSTINTKYNEICPFIAADGKTLYFASDKPGGFGSSDLYVIQRLDDTWKKWSEPKNLGSDFNTSGWDAYYCIDAKAEYAYMVTNVNGNCDIVRKLLKPNDNQVTTNKVNKQEIKTNDIIPDPVVLIYGNVYNSKKKTPIGAKIDYQILGTGVNAGIANTDPSTGSYKIVLNYGKKYGIFAKADGFISVSDNIDLTQYGTYQEIKKDLFLTPIEIGQIVKLNNIFFEFNKAELGTDSYPELDRVVLVLNQNPNMKIEIDGHTDNVGQDDYNQKLSENRAKAVYEYLSKKGIEKQRLAYKGFGKLRPVDDNQTDIGRQKNRRVEFTILKN
jgi:OmpA-OmpF porin, OOP family